MEMIRVFEISLILLIQNLGEWLKTPMLVFSFFGKEEFYLIIMPLIYWSIDTRLGIRIGAMILLSNWVNYSLKLLFHAPRPYWVDLKVKVLSTETSFGMPSGHAQNAAGVWGLLAASLKGRIWQSLVIISIVIIGFSRLYLGVHFISDVVVGWLLGSLLLWCFIRLENPIFNWLVKRSFIQNSGLSILSSLVIFCIPLLIRSIGINWQLPQVWVQNAAVSAPDSPINPLGISNAVSLAGTWLGMAFGLTWFNTIGFINASTGSPWQKISRYLIGMFGLIIIYAGLDKIFPDNLNLLGYIFRYVRYALVGFWITGLAPLTFRSLGLLPVGKNVSLSYNVKE